MKQNSKRLTSYIISALFLAIALVVYFELIIPSYAALQDDKGQAASENNLLANEQSIVAEVSSTLATYQGEASTTQSVNMSLPVGPNIADSLAQLYGIAANTGFSLEGTSITVQTVQATAAANTATTAIGSAAASGGSIVRPSGSVSFELQGNGSYESLKSFLMGLESNIRLFNVTAISIQPSGSGSSKAPVSSTDLFNYTITVVTYYQS